MNFYPKVLTHFANTPGLQFRLRMEVASETGIPQPKWEKFGQPGEIRNLKNLSLIFKMINLKRSVNFYL
ncbi:MAG: hypothetical protein ACUVRL_00525 [Candidatus Saccharicenans sp.]